MVNVCENALGYYFHAIVRIVILCHMLNAERWKISYGAKRSTLTTAKDILSNIYGFRVLCLLDGKAILCIYVYVTTALS